MNTTRNINEYLASGEAGEVKVVKVTLQDSGEEVSLIYDGTQNIADFQTTLRLSLNSLKLDESYTMSGALNSVALKKEFRDETLHIVWEGQKDQSIPANQDASGLIRAYVSVLQDDLIFFEPFGAPSLVTMPYSYAIPSTSANARIFGITFRTAEPLAAGDFVSYKVVSDPGLPTETLIFIDEEELTQNYIDGDDVTIWFKNPLDQHIGDSVHVDVLNGKGDATTSVLVYQADTIPNPWTSFQTRLMSLDPIATENYVDANTPTPEQLNWLNNLTGDVVSDTLTTSDATWTTISTFPEPVDGSFLYETFVSAKRQGVSQVGIFGAQWANKVVLGVSDTLGGIDINFREREALVNIRVVENGNASELQVRGRNGQDWDWEATSYKIRTL